MNVEPIPVPALDTWPAIVALIGSPVAVASLKAMHLLGAAILIGSVLAFDLRILGWHKGIAVRALARYLLPLALAALVLIVPSGIALFALEASTLLESAALKYKLGLLCAAAAVAIFFRTSAYKGMDCGDHLAPTPGSARLCAGASIILWLGVLFCAATLGRSA